MKVKDLRELLKDFDQNAWVQVKKDPYEEESVDEAVYAYRDDDGDLVISV